MSSAAMSSMRSAVAPILITLISGTVSSLANKGTQRNTAQHTQSTQGARSMTRVQRRRSSSMVERQRIWGSEANRRTLTAESPCRRRCVCLPPCLIVVMDQSCTTLRLRAHAARISSRKRTSSRYACSSVSIHRQSDRATGPQARAAFAAMRLQIVRLIVCVCALVSFVYVAGRRRVDVPRAVLYQGVHAQAP